MTTEEYNRVVDLHSDHVYRFILKSVNNEMIAEDIVQETYEKLWMKHEDVEFIKSKSYIFSTAYHTMIDMIRREKKQENWDKVKSDDVVYEDQYDDLNEILHKAIERLPIAQRSAILLRDYEGYAYHEIEEITGLSESQVKVYIYRARIFLRNYLEKLEINIT